jgi:hypothetical protein
MLLSGVGFSSMVHFSFFTFLPVGLLGHFSQKTFTHWPSVSGAPHSGQTGLISVTRGLFAVVVIHVLLGHRIKLPLTKPAMVDQQFFNSLLNRQFALRLLELVH